MKNNSDILQTMLENNEEVYWEVTGSTDDWKFNPIYFLATIFTLGLFLVGLKLYRQYRSYVLTSSRLIIISGILGRSVDEIELFRIIDSRTTQTLFDRWVDIGDIVVSSSDMTGFANMKKIPHPHHVRDSLRQAYMQARASRGTVVLEQS